MPRYRVRDGQHIAHDGAILDSGAVLELPRAVAEDHANGAVLEEVDAVGQPVTPRRADDLARFRTHERVGVLRDRLAVAKARVIEIAEQLAAEDRRLADEVAAATPTTSPNAPVTALKE